MGTAGFGFAGFANGLGSGYRLGQEIQNNRLTRQMNELKLGQMQRAMSLRQSDMDVQKSVSDETQQAIANGQIAADQATDEYMNRVLPQIALNHARYGDIDTAKKLMDFGQTAHAGDVTNKIANVAIAGHIADQSGNVAPLKTAFRNLWNNTLNPGVTGGSKFVDLVVGDKGSDGKPTGLTAIMRNPDGTTYKLQYPDMDTMLNKINTFAQPHVYFDHLQRAGADKAWNKVSGAGASNQSAAAPAANAIGSADLMSATPMADQGAAKAPAATDAASTSPAAKADDVAQMSPDVSPQASPVAAEGAPAQQTQAPAIPALPQIKQPIGAPAMASPAMAAPALVPPPVQNVPIPPPVALAQNAAAPAAAPSADDATAATAAGFGIPPDAVVPTSDPAAVPANASPTMAAAPQAVPADLHAQISAGLASKNPQDVAAAKAALMNHLANSSGAPEQTPANAGDAAAPAAAPPVAPAVVPVSAPAAPPAPPPIAPAGPLTRAANQFVPGPVGDVQTIATKPADPAVALQAAVQQPGQAQPEQPVIPQQLAEYITALKESNDPEQRKVGDALGVKVLEEYSKPQTVAPGNTIFAMGKPVFTNNVGTFDTKTLTTLADQYLSGDKSVLQNLGRGNLASINIANLRNRILTRAKELGISPTEIAARMGQFNSYTAAQSATGHRAGSVEMASIEAKNLAGLVVDTSAQVPRTSMPVFNRHYLAFETNTGDPNVVKFTASLNSLINAYARAVNPSGSSTVSDKEHAREILETAMSHGQIKAGVGQILQEIDQITKSPGEASETLKREFEQRADPTKARQRAASPTQGVGVPAPEARQVNQVYMTPKGPARWMGSGWLPVGQ